MSDNLKAHKIKEHLPKPNFEFLNLKGGVQLMAGCAHRKILKKFSGVLGLKLITLNFDAIFSTFDPQKKFSEVFDVRNRFLASTYP